MKKLPLLAVLVVLILLSGCIPVPSDPVITTTSPNYIEDVNGELIPAFENVDASELDPKLFSRDEKGRMVYSDADVTLLNGIDVSVFQGDINWDRVKSDGIDFAFIRVGGRGYGPNGVMFEDEKFYENCQNACNAGLDVGVYFFSQAISVEEAVEEAEFVLNAVKDFPITLPVVFDWETMDFSGARTEGIKGEQVTRFAEAFCNTVLNGGYEPMVYLNREFGYFIYNLEDVSRYNIWLAEYSELPTFYYNYKVWQYDKNGVVDGIEGTVDMNIALSTLVRG